MYLFLSCHNFIYCKAKGDDKPVELCGSSSMMKDDETVVNLCTQGYLAPYS